MKKLVIVLVILFCVIVVGAVAAFFGVQYMAQQTAEKEVKRILDSLPEVEGASYGAVKYSLFDNELVVTDVVLDLKPGGPEKFEIARIEVLKPDLDRINNLFSGGPEAAEKNVADSFTVTGAKLYDKEKSMTLARYHVSDFKMGPLPFTAETPAKDIFSPQNASKVIGALSASVLEIEDFVFQETGKGPPIFSLKKAALTGIEGGRIASYEVTGFSVAPPGEDGTVTIASVSAKDLDYTKALDLLASGSEPKGIGDVIQLGSARIQGVEVVTPKTGTVKLREASLSNYKLVGQVPASLTFDVKGVEVPVADIEDKKAKATLTQLGYEKVLINFNLDYAWDEGSKRLDVKKISLGVDQAADIILSLTLENVDLAGLQNPGDALGLLGTAALKRVELRYVDASLADRALKFAAMMQGADPEQLREMLVQQVAAQKQLVGSSPAGAQAVDAVVAFIRNPGTLVIVAEPPAPMPLMMIAGQAKTGPDKIAETLNVSVTSEAGAAGMATAPTPAPKAEEPAPQEEPAPATESPKAEEPKAPEPEPAQPEPPKAEAPKEPAPQPKEAEPEEKQAEPSAPGEFKAVPLKKLPFGEKTDQ